MTGDDAVVGIDRGGQTDRNVARLGLGDLQGGLQFAKLHHLGQRSARGHVRAYRHGDRQRIKLTGKPGTHLECIRLSLIERQQCLRLVDLGLGAGKLHLDVLLVHIELFQA